MGIVRCVSKSINKRKSVYSVTGGKNKIKEHSCLFHKAWAEHCGSSKDSGK